MSSDKVRTAIVFQGGGALGAYECGVLEALYKAREPFTPEVITGISIGAVNAAILAGAGIEVFRAQTVNALVPERREALLDELGDDLPEHWLEEGRQRREHRSLYHQVLLKDRWDELPGWDELPVHRHRRHIRVGRVGHPFEQ